LDTRRVNHARGLLQQRRMRVLASDARAGSWARGKARVAQREYLREHWRLYAALMVGLLGATLLVASLMPTGFLRGLVVGALLVVGPATLWSWTLQVTGTAPVMMGDMAEQWTAGELRKLRGRGWRMVNHFVLAKDDVDHVLVGPGGAFAFETKWSATSWRSDFGRARLRDAVAQAKANARILRLWHPLKSRQVHVEPVVVLWGGGVKEWPDGERISQVDGVTVLTGHGLPKWAAGRSATALTDEQIADAWSALDAQVTRRDPLDELDHPVPASLEAIVARIGLAFLSGIFGLLFIGELLRLTDSWWLAVLIGGASVVPAFPLLRRSLVRFAAWGWLAGVGLPAVALSIAEAIDLLAV
jgi:hypothetical protein